MSTPSPARFSSFFEARPKLWRGLMYAVLTGLCVAWTRYAGRDISWDALNYHVYAGFSSLHDRLGQDFFAAFPAYFTPYGYIPFWLMLEADWSAWEIGMSFAIVHSMLLWFTWEICLVTVRELPWGPRQVLAAGTTLFAALNPVVLIVMGSSFIDIPTSIPILAAWWLVLRVFPDGRWRPLLLAGLLMGLGTGLKMSNALFGLACLPVLLLFSGTVQHRLGLVSAYSAGCVLGGLAVIASWSLKLSREFGSPLFPLFNQHFKSPDFTTASAKMDRFLPDGWHDLLLLPFRMLLPERMVQLEIAAPDIRYLVVIALLLAWVGVAGLRQVRSPKAVPRRPDVSTRVLLALAMGAGLSGLLWVFSTGNGRYFIPGATLLAVLAGGLIWRVASARAAPAYVMLASLLTLQAGQVAIGSEKRLGQIENWKGPWLSVSVPQALIDEPHLYLGLEAQSSSFVLPWLHPASAMVGITSGQVIDPDGPGGERTRRLIDRHTGRLRMLATLSSVRDDGRFPEPNLSVYNDRLLPWGLKIDRRDCQSIDLKEAHVSVTISELDPALPSHSGAILTCALTAASEADRLAQVASRNEVDRIFAHLEAACPTLFAPPGGFSTGNEHRWSRAYPGSDTTAFTTRERVYFYNAFLGGDPVMAGRIDDWKKAPQPLDCSVRTAPAFEGALVARDVKSRTAQGAGQ